MRKIKVLNYIKVYENIEYQNLKVSFKTKKNITNFPNKLVNILQSFIFIKTLKDPR